MSAPDLINGAFEALGGFAILGHCWRLYKDKQVRGASWFATVFFTAWGVWNLYYYPHLDQWLSFTGGLFIVAANTLWVGLMLYYIRQEKRAEYVLGIDVAGLPSPDMADAYDVGYHDGYRAGSSTPFE